MAIAGSSPVAFPEYFSRVRAAVATRSPLPEAVAVPPAYRQYITESQPAPQFEYAGTLQREQQALILLVNFREVYPEEYRVLREVLHPTDELPDAEDPMRVQQWTAIAFICTSNAVAFGSASPVESLRNLAEVQSAIKSGSEWPASAVVEALDVRQNLRWRPNLTSDPKGVTGWYAAAKRQGVIVKNPVLARQEAELAAERAISRSQQPAELAEESVDYSEATASPMSQAGPSTAVSEGAMLQSLPLVTSFVPRSVRLRPAVSVPLGTRVPVTRPVVSSSFPVSFPASLPISLPTLPLSTPFFMGGLNRTNPARVPIGSGGQQSGPPPQSAPVAASGLVLPQTVPRDVQRTSVDAEVASVQQYLVAQVNNGNFAAVNAATVYLQGLGTSAFSSANMAAVLGTSDLRYSALEKLKEKLALPTAPLVSSTPVPVSSASFATAAGVSTAVPVQSVLTSAAPPPVVSVTEAVQPVPASAASQPADHVPVSVAHVTQRPVVRDTAPGLGGTRIKIPPPPFFHGREADRNPTTVRHWLSLQSGRVEPQIQSCWLSITYERRLLTGGMRCFSDSIQLIPSFHGQHLLMSSWKGSYLVFHARKHSKRLRRWSNRQARVCRSTISSSDNAGRS